MTGHEELCQIMRLSALPVVQHPLMVTSLNMVGHLWHYLLLLVNDGYHLVILADIAWDVDE